MAKVYVLTTGEYSEYGIEGVFSTRELAESARAVGIPDGDVEEYDLDEMVAFEVGPMWTASIDKETGDVQIRKDGAVRFRHPSAAAHGVGSTFLIAESPVSREHAIKVAVEARQEWLRTRGIAAAADDVAGRVPL